MPTTKIKWTPEKEQLLKKLWPSDVKLDELIRRVCGLNESDYSDSYRSAVCGKAKRLGLPNRPKQQNTWSKSADAPLTQAPAEAADVQTDAVIPVSPRLTLNEMDREGMCKWPLGDPASEAFRYCGSPALGKSPYCSHHSKLAYQPSSTRSPQRA